MAAGQPIRCGQRCRRKPRLARRSKELQRRSRQQPIHACTRHPPRHGQLPAVRRTVTEPHRRRVRLFWSDLIVPVRNCPATICGGGRGMAGVLQPATTYSNSSRDRPNTPAASLLLLRVPLAPLLSHVLVSTPTNVAGRSPSNDQVRHKTPGHTRRRPHSRGANSKCRTVLPLRPRANATASTATGSIGRRPHIDPSSSSSQSDAETTPSDASSSSTYELEWILDARPPRIVEGSMIQDDLSQSIDEPALQVHQQSRHPHRGPWVAGRSGTRRSLVGHPPSLALAGLSVARHGGRGAQLRA